jgi:hypothetical protein
MSKDILKETLIRHLDEWIAKSKDAQAIARFNEEADYLEGYIDALEKVKNWL